jgi:hypothetical protein
MTLNEVLGAGLRPSIDTVTSVGNACSVSYLLSKAEEERDRKAEVAQSVKSTGSTASRLAHGW